MKTIANYTLIIITMLSLAACSLIAPAPSAPTAPAAPGARIANPASTFCIEKGGKLQIITEAGGGQVGMCLFPDGSQCEEWAYLRGQCAPGKAVAPLSLETLKNAVYPSEFPVGKKAILVDGGYEEVIQPAAATKLTITMLPVYALGDLNGDGAEDAAVILAASTGGSGTFIYLYAVVNSGGKPMPEAPVQLGDRVSVNAVSIQSAEIWVEMIIHGPQDPLCCATQKATKRFRLQGGQLVSVGT